MAKKLKKTVRSKVLAFMSQEKLKIRSALDTKEAISRCNEKIWVYAKKIEMHEQRKVFFRQNAIFELYRRRFYKSLESAEVVDNQERTSKIKEFRETTWTKRGDESNCIDIEKYLVERLSREKPLNALPKFEEFRVMRKWQPNWKAARPDGIFNFFINKFMTLHLRFYEVVRKIYLFNSQRRSEESFTL
jgi:hypothetical protein